jgi:hypothetical protein
MSNATTYKPKRLGITLPRPTVGEWRNILRKARHADTGHDSPCWIWCGRIDVDGYPEVKFRGAKRFTHRVAIAWKLGECPARRDGEHLCRQHACINPAHLTTLPPKENAAGRSEEMPEQVNKHNVRSYAKRHTAVLPF